MINQKVPGGLIRVRYNCEHDALYRYDDRRGLVVERIVVRGMPGLACECDGGERGECECRHGDGLRGEAPQLQGA